MRSPLSLGGSHRSLLKVRQYLYTYLRAALWLPWSWRIVWDYASGILDIHIQNFGIPLICVLL